MNSETKQLRSLVAAWEKKKRHAEKMVARLRSALDLIEKEATTPEPRRTTRRTVRKSAPAPTPFTPKYSKTSKDYIVELLSDGRQLALGEIREALATHGLRYSQQALAVSMLSLEKSGRVRKRRAPNGSAAIYVFELSRDDSGRAAP